MICTFMGASCEYLHAKRDEKLSHTDSEADMHCVRASKIVADYRDKEADLLDKMSNHCETYTTTPMEQQDVDVANMIRTTKYTASVPRSRGRQDNRVQIYDASIGNAGPLGENRPQKKRKLAACKELYSQIFLPHSSGWSTDPNERPSGAPAARDIERRRRDREANLRRGNANAAAGADSDGSL